MKFILEGFWELQRKIRRVSDDPQVLSERYAEHRDILHALENRDARGAEYYMQRHFDRMIRNVRAGRGDGG